MNNDYESFLEWAEKEGVVVGYEGMGEDIMRPMASACYSAWRAAKEESEASQKMIVEDK